ncbi:uncharacterized protein LOC132201467 [Neocloeon triangulifer]|uniref:uncharacterized protein LOC132201467 n=1 Tax=Neocloeon triangulifer TaxID=2078957 RepID=UPI00286F1F84|nr:uncharacterized protein LOC132201467 [Neocloeon triangulifer]
MNTCQIPMDALLPPLDPVNIVELTAPLEFNKNQESMGASGSSLPDNETISKPVGPQFEAELPPSLLSLCNEDAVQPHACEEPVHPAEQVFSAEKTETAVTVEEGQPSAPLKSTIGNLERLIVECLSTSPADENETAVQAQGKRENNQSKQNGFTRQATWQENQIERDADDRMAIQSVYIDKQEPLMPVEVNKIPEEQEVLEVEGDSDLETTEPVIKECRVVVDRRVVARYFYNMKKRKRRQLEREMAQQEESNDVPTDSSSGADSRSRRESTLMQEKSARSVILTRVKCKECQDSFLGSQNLRNHFRVKHLDNEDEEISECGRVVQFQYCPLCSHRYRMKGDFVRHMFMQHKIGRQLFEKVDSYNREMVAEEVAKRLQKQISKEEASALKKVEVEIASIRRTERKATTILPVVEKVIFDCQHCPKKFDIRGSLSRHMTYAHPELRDEYLRNIIMQAQAPVPKKPMAGPKSAPFRQKVVPMASAIKAPPPPTPPVANFFSCEWCRDRLKTTKQLNTHLRSKHSMPENMSPDGCNLPEFFTALELHFYVVEQEENCYECVSCKETFAEKVGLLEHFSGEHLKSKVEGMQIKLECGVCNHKDSDVRNLHDHMWNEHANQKLEEIVMRVAEVRKNHRCGDECALLWKKPVVSVVAAPRAMEAKKRPSSEVVAHPRPEKSRRQDFSPVTPQQRQFDPSMADDDEDLRRMEELEEQELLKQQQLSDKRREAYNKYRNKLSSAKQRKREINQKYKAKKAQIRAAAAAQAQNVAKVQSKVVQYENKTLANKDVFRVKRCLLCQVPCEDVEKHMEEVHMSSTANIKKSIEARVKTPIKVPPQPVRKPNNSKPMPLSKKSATQSTTSLVRCKKCNISFPDIVALMNHRINCMFRSPTFATSTSSSTSTHPPSVATPESSKKTQQAGAQFVLMEDAVGPSSFKCQSCRKNFTSVGEWQAHIQEKHLDEVMCELCNMPFKDELTLGKHINRQHGVSYPCVACGNQFSNKKLFIQHVFQAHRLNKQLFAKISLLNLDQIAKIFESQGFTASERSNEPEVNLNLLEPEIKLESPDMPVVYQCELCDACYSTPQEIRYHMSNVH